MAFDFGNFLSNIGQGTYSPWLTWGTMLGGLGTALGAGSSIYNAINESNRAAQLERMARKPLDIASLYNPANAAERQAIVAQLGLGAGGYGAGGLGQSMIAQILAKDAAQRWQAATQAALQQRQLGMQAITGEPTLPMMGDVGAYGKAVQLEQQRQDALRARQAQSADTNRFYGVLSDMMKGWGGGIPGTNADIPMAPADPGIARNVFVPPGEGGISPFNYGF